MTDQTADPTIYRRNTNLSRPRVYFNIIYALMMHDIKNRFFGSGWGQIVMIIWPFAHIIVLITIYYVVKRPNPYGSSLLQYSSISVFPFICFNYVSRWISYSATTNRSFLQYAIIKPLDLIVARTLLEVVSITMVGILVILLVSACGDNAIPAQPSEAVYAVCATIFLAIGFGVPNAVMSFIVPMWNLVVIVFIIGAYAASGILYVPSNLPDQIRIPLSYNPVLHCTEWLRIAYYSDYPTSVLDKSYLLEFSLISLAFGLVLERLLRRFF